MLGRSIQIQDLHNSLALGTCSLSMGPVSSSDLFSKINFVIYLTIPLSTPHIFYFTKTLRLPTLDSFLSLPPQHLGTSLVFGFKNLKRFRNLDNSTQIYFCSCPPAPFTVLLHHSSLFPSTPTLPTPLRTPTSGSNCVRINTIKTSTMNAFKSI
jgi:hypothetical protein